jgi:hypothetical protein
MASGGTINQILIKNSNTNYDTTWVNYIPTGGTNNQILLKTGSTDYATAWFNYIPTGGTNNQILLKNASTNYATTWVNYIPTGGTDNQILLKTGSTDYATAWFNYIPTGGTVNQVLAKTGSTDYATAWVESNTGVPTIAIQGDPGFFVNNSSSTYGTATRMPLNVAGLTTTFIEGSMTIGPNGIQPGTTGVYEIRMDGFVLDAGGGNTLFTCYIGVNGTSRAQRLTTVPVSSYSNFSISCVSSLNGGELIDFRFGSSGGERVDVDGVSIFVRYLLSS